MTQNTVKKCSENASKKVQNSKIFLERKKNREEGEGKREKKEQKEKSENEKKNSLVWLILVTWSVNFLINM